MKLNEVSNYKTVIVVAALLIALICGGFAALNYMEQQRIAAEEQARIEEEMRVAEEMRLEELETAKISTLIYLEEQKEDIVEYLTEENLEDLDAIKKKIYELGYIEGIESIIEEIDVIIAIANEARAEAEALAAQQQQYYVEQNYNYGNTNEQEQIQQSLGITEDYAKEWIAQRESGGSYEAHNGRYWGRYQLNSGWFDGYTEEFILYTEEGHQIQEQQIEAYVAGRYGSWVNAYYFWQSHGWY